MQNSFAKIHADLQGPYGKPALAIGPIWQKIGLHKGPYKKAPTKIQTWNFLHKNTYSFMGALCKPIRYIWHPVGLHLGPPIN